MKRSLLIFLMMISARNCSPASVIAWFNSASRFILGGRSDIVCDVRTIVARGDVDAFRAYVKQHPINIDQLYGKTGYTLMHVAALSGNPLMVRELHTQGGEPNHATTDGIVPLHIAAGILSRPVIDELLMQGAKKNVSDSWGNHPIDLIAIIHPEDDYPAKKIDVCDRLITNEIFVGIFSGPQISEHRSSCLYALRENKTVSYAGDFHDSKYLRNDSISLGKINNVKTSYHPTIIKRCMERISKIKQ